MDIVAQATVQALYERRPFSWITSPCGYYSSAERRVIPLNTFSQNAPFQAFEQVITRAHEAWPEGWRAP
jgi:hypothetical protein